MARRAPLSFRLYRRISAVASPLAPLLLNYRLKRGKEHPERLAERRGIASAARPQGALIWIHGASVGELNSVFPLIEKLRTKNTNLLVTSGTVTSAKIAGERLPREAIHQFLPVDTPRFVSQFLRHWRPSLGLFVDSDLWPNLVTTAARGRVPLIIVNGRMSERSFKRWRFFPRSAAALLENFDLVLTQSALDAERFAALGAKRVQATGNLKLDVPVPPADLEKWTNVRKAVSNRRVVLGASTHAGEELALFDAHRRLHKAFPGLLTIVAPRHPHRGPEIAMQAKAGGLSVALRSKEQLPDAQTDIYVADTIGELGIFYRLSPIVFVGRSLTGEGGQNPIEAAKLENAIVHGPHVGNFAEIYAALDAANGAIEVANAAELALAVARLLKDETLRQHTADAALKTVARLGGALERTLGELEPYLLQLQLEQPAHDA